VINLSQLETARRPQQNPHRDAGRIHQPRRGAGSESINKVQGQVSLFVQWSTTESWLNTPSVLIGYYYFKESPTTLTRKLMRNHLSVKMSRDSIQSATASTPRALATLCSSGSIFLLTQSTPSFCVQLAVAFGSEVSIT
jgi:hypothetical protein